MGLFELPEWLPLEAWNGWIEMREKQRWKLTERAKRMWLADLEAWRMEGYDIAYILNEATKKDWRGLFVNDRTPRIVARPEVETNDRDVELINWAIKESLRTGKNADALLREARKRPA